MGCEVSSKTDSQGLHGGAAMDVGGPFVEPFPVAAGGLPVVFRGDGRESE